MLEVVIFDRVKTEVPKRGIDTPRCVILMVKKQNNVASHTCILVAQFLEINLC